ncbi:related to formate nitrite family of transporters [Lecanosticta acicola]|uniref:Related to formate nitrite family of transporters n=1 Tax=Lecanosticta acicola TaxID=111012 RepID=A0AAI8YYG3_9PEZI|nr:related to formate nitrite family of transporters [Lecanosticta acicola]
MALPNHLNVVVNAYNPPQTVELAGRAGVAKANMRPDKAFISAVLAGMLLGFACAVTMSTETAPWYQHNAPGLIRMIGAIVFPFGLVMIVTSGLELVTANFMITIIPVLQRRLSILKMLKHWFIVFWGNLAGSLFLVAIITGYGGVFSKEPYRGEAIRFAQSKAVTPEWHMIFLRAIGANWLVCMSCFLAFQAREFFSKVMAIWWPTFAFVALGLDHTVANMYFIPTAIFVGAPDITVGYYIWKSLIPTVLGNIVGGGLFVGVVQWYLHQSSEPPVAIDGKYYDGDQSPLIGQTTSQAPQIGREQERKSSEAMV